MFREDQLDSNVEIGGGGQHMEKMQGLEKTETAACLCFGQGNSKKDCCGRIVHRMKRNNLSWHIGKFGGISY